MPLYGIDQLTDSFRTVLTNTIRVAEDIPESEYQYRPAPASRSVAETLVHIAWLAGADRFMHEEKRLASFDGFDFAAFLANEARDEGYSESRVCAFTLRKRYSDAYALQNLRRFGVTFLEVG